MADGRFYSRYYGEDETPSRAFRVLSLGVNKCAAKLDYSGILRRHPSNHRFSKTRGRTLDSLVVVRIVNGHGVFRSKASGELPVPANSLFFVFPGVNHDYRYDDETGWDEEWMELDPTVALPLLNAAGITPKSPLRTFASASGVSEAFQNLLDASRASGVAAKMRVDALAHLVIEEAIAAWRKGTDAETGQVVERMRQALVSDVGERTLVRDAARRAGKCELRMRDLFKQATGLSPKKYQMRAGRKAGDVAKKIHQFVIDKGYGDTLLYGPCHGAGQMECEYPFLETSSQYTLEAGMTFMQDMFMHRGTKDGFRWEDGLLVKAHGPAEMLSSYGRKINILDR